MYIQYPLQKENDHIGDHIDPHTAKHFAQVVVVSASISNFTRVLRVSEARGRPEQRLFIIRPHQIYMCSSSTSDLKYLWVNVAVLVFQRPTSLDFGRLATCVQQRPGLHAAQSLTYSLTCRVEYCRVILE